MSNFWQRTFTGIVFVVVVIGSILVDYMAFIGVFAVFSIVALYEFYNIMQSKQVSPLKFHGLLAGNLIFLTTAFKNISLIETGQAEKYYVVIFLYILVLFVAELYRKTETAYHNISICVAGLIYISIPFSFLISIPNVASHEINVGQNFLIIFFVLLWTSDTFAYLTGRWLGKHKLFERISPKKSWEGFLGGSFFTLLFAVGISFYYTELTLLEWILAAIIIVVFGTFGDLVESMLKRSAGVKDSGKFFPGHGGVLDRFDAVFFSAPFIYFYLKFLI